MARIPTSPAPRPARNVNVVLDMFIGAHYLERGCGLYEWMRASALYLEFPLKMEEEDLTCGTPLDHFAESEELSSIVSTLPHVCGELRLSENATEKFTSTCTDLYSCS